MIRPRTPQPPSSVAAHYDDLDPYYRELWGEHLHHGLFRGPFDDRRKAVLRLLDLVADRAGIAADDVVLDVGCGYGATARYLASSYGARVTGITLSPAQHAYAAAPERATPGVDIRLGDWLATEPEAGAHSVVLAVESTEHMDDKAGFFQRAATALCPGGRVAVCAWLAAADPAAWKVRRLLRPICEEGRLPGLGTRAEYREWLRGAGFRDIVFKDLTRHARRTWTHAAHALVQGLATRQRYWRFLLDRRQQNRVFARTLARIWLAYHTGAMRYGLFVGRKPDATR